METATEQKKVYTGFTRAVAGRLVFKRYKNRKIYCVNQSCYVTLAEAATLVKESPDFDIDGMDKNDFLFAMFVDNEKSLQSSDKASNILLLEILTCGSLSKFASKKVKQ